MGYGFVIFFVCRGLWVAIGGCSTIVGFAVACVANGGEMICCGLWVFGFCLGWQWSKRCTALGWRRPAGTSSLSTLGGSRTNRLPMYHCVGSGGGMSYGGNEINQL